LGGAYTPGLTVSAQTTIRKVRRLPIKGEVFVKVGDIVEPATILAQAMLPGPLQNVKLAEQLGVPPNEVPEYLLAKVGDMIEKDQPIAQSKGFFGLFKSLINSPVKGTIENISEISGHAQIREPSTPVERTAYIRGKVIEVMPLEGAVIEAEGALVQGIFGIGGERLGDIIIVGDEDKDVLDVSDLSEEMAGKVVICAGGITGAALKKADKIGIIGLIVASLLNDLDLRDYLGFDIGVAITGQESIPLSLILTEGFGNIRMAKRTFELLKSLEGKQASINGTTQIRAGVQRPEIIVPMAHVDEKSAGKGKSGAMELKIGTPIRVIRQPYFGQLGAVVELPPELTVIESGAHVRILKAKLESGEQVIVPRANVEIIAE
jgi:hypothetical protein